MIQRTTVALERGAAVRIPLSSALAAAPPVPAPITQVPARVPSPGDRLILADLANGRSYEQVSQRWGVGRSAIGMRIRRLGDGENHRAQRLCSVVQVVATAVREGWIVWNGTQWIPASRDEVEPPKRKRGRPLKQPAAQRGTG